MFFRSPAFLLVIGLSVFVPLKGFAYFDYDALIRANEKQDAFLERRLQKINETFQNDSTFLIEIQKRNTAIINDAMNILRERKKEHDAFLESRLEKTITDLNSTRHNLTQQWEKAREKACRKQSIGDGIAGIYNDNSCERVNNTYGEYQNDLQKEFDLEEESIRLRYDQIKLDSDARLMEKILDIREPTTSFVPFSNVRGYYKKDATFVRPHFRTLPDSTTLNNWSTWGNVNPFTGRKGTVMPHPGGIGTQIKLYERYRRNR